MILSLKVRCGTQQFVVKVEIDGENCEEKEKNEEEIVRLKVVKDLREFLASKTNTDPNRVKIIHKGKSIGTDIEEPLTNYKFADGDTLLVMGMRISALSSKNNNNASKPEDHGLHLLNEYEKKNLVKLNETFTTNGRELSELERNFLEGDKANEMIRKMDRQLKAFTDTSLRHMENIDGLQIFDESTSDEQKTRNREKRKTMINGIQELLNANDKLQFQLSQHQFRTEHPDEGHH